MAKSGLQGIEIWNKPQGGGGQRIITVQAAKARGHVESIDNDENCSFIIPLASDATPLLTERAVIRYQYAPLTPGATGDFLEYLFTELEKAHGGDGNLVKVIGRGLILVLTDSGLVYRQSFGARKEFTFTDTLTPSAWMSTYVIPALARRGYGWITLGTVTPTANVTLSVARWNAMHLMQELKSSTLCEFALRQNGTAGYYLDLVTAINSGVAPVYLRSGRSLASMKIKTNAINMATLVTPFGDLGATELGKTVQHVQWRVTAVDVTNKDIAIAPVDGGAPKCIRFDGQFSTVSGLLANWYVLRLATGRLIQITDAFAATQKLRLSDITTFATGELIELRESAAGAVRVDSNTPAEVPLTAAPSGLTLTLSNPFSASDPVPANDLHLDWMLRPSAQVLSTSSTNVADVAGTTTFQQDITCTTTAGVAAGDWGFRHTNAGTPWGLFEGYFTVESVQSGTVLRVVPRYSWQDGKALTTLGATTKVLKIYRAKAATLITDEVASTNVLTVASVASVAANDLCEFYVDTGGTPPGALPAGSSIGTYGQVEKTYTRSDLRGECNLAHDANPYFDAWATTPGAPDNWTTNHSTLVTRVAPTIGPGSTYQAHISAVGFGDVTILSKTIQYRPVAGNKYVSLRVRIKTGSSNAGIGWDGGVDARVRIGICPSTIGQWQGASAILYAASPAAGVPSATGAVARVADPDSIYEVDIPLIDVFSGANNCPMTGFHLQVSLLVSNAVNTTAYDAGGCMLVQDDGVPETGAFVRFDGAQLWSDALAKVDQTDAPLPTYETNIVDWARLDLSSSDMELLKGASVYPDDQVLLNGAAAPLLRIVRIECDDDEIGRSQIQVATLPDSLTNQLAET